MSELALARRLRPATFAEVKGQEPIVRTLRRAIDAGSCPQALLFAGPRGTGKTSTARIVAAALTCEARIDREPCTRCEPCRSIRDGRALDVRESNAASANRIDDVRETLMPFISTPPVALRRKVLILDEVQRFSVEAWDALLKPLEEPPAYLTVIFATTDPDKIPVAIASRLARFDFRPLSAATIEAKLVDALTLIGRTATPEALTLVATLADGGMRDAETMLDQLLGSGADPVTAEGVEELLGLPNSERIERLATALLRADASTALALLAEFEQRGRDPERVTASLADLVRRALHASIATGAVPYDPAVLPVGVRLAGHLDAVALAGRSRAELTALADALGDAVRARSETERRLALELLALGGR